jgi:hypothetical protein
LTSAEVRNIWIAGRDALDGANDVMAKRAAAFLTSEVLPHK